MMVHMPSQRHERGRGVIKSSSLHCLCPERADKPQNGEHIFVKHYLIEG